MGTIMRLYPTPESDLRAFSVAPRTLQIWLRQPHPHPDLSLEEHWEDLDALIAAEPAAQSRALLTPQGGDYTYPTAADRGGHGLSLASTKQLIHIIQQIGRPQIEAYVRQRWAAQERQAPDLNPEEVAAATEELLLQLTRLRDSCALAVGKHYGVLMALWATPPAK